MIKMGYTLNLISIEGNLFFSPIFFLRILFFNASFNVTSKTLIEPILEENMGHEVEKEVESMEDVNPPQETPIKLDQGNINELLRFLSFSRDQHYAIQQVIGPKVFYFSSKFRRKGRKGRKQ